MLRLLLLRHAKAEPGANDFARPLNAAGKRQAVAVGKKIADALGRPDLILSSPARRTRETLTGLLPSLRPPPEARFLEDLYSGDAETYREVIKQNSENAATVLVVAHNPALRDLAIDLVTTAEITRLARFPVATLAAIAFPAERWDDIGQGTGRLSTLLFTDPTDGD